MKKILFCAAVVALATACTEDEFGGSQIGSQTKQGLYFEASPADGATTRGELYKDENGTYPFFWYAEQDQINIFALNAEALENGSYGDNSSNKGVATQSSGTWSTGTAAIYKATRSEGNGRFTAASPTDMLTLKDVDEDDIAGSTATIVATYGINATSIKSELDDSNKPVPGKLSELKLTTTTGNATQTVDRMNQVVAPMWSVSSAVKENAYDAFGEKAQLKLIRPFPVLRFTTANAGKYTDKFGKLESIKLTTLTPEGAAGSDIAYDDNKVYTVTGTTTGFDAGWQETSNANIVTVNVTDGTWKDGDAVYMTVAPVERSAEEILKIEYTFENISFTLDGTQDDAKAFEIIKTKNNWTSVDANGNPNAVTALPALDINNYDYLLTNASSGNDRTLIVNKGDFSSIFDNTGAIIWGGGTVAKTEVNTIIVAEDVNMTESDLQGLSKFTNLASIELNNVTSIPANTFNGLSAKLKEIILPAVTKINKGFINSKFTILENLNLASYKFEDEDVNAMFFNTTTANTLKTLNISGVESMMPTFGIDRALSFKGYTALTEVTVQDGIVVAPNGFNGCTSLKTINGKLNLTNAVSAFDMESSTNSVLETVNVTGTTIPEKAFKKCTGLKNILYNGAQIAPTSVGASAFEGATSLKYMDLANATTIGASAFSGCTSYAGKAEGVNILEVGVSTVEESIFASTAVYMVHFTNAEVINKSIFASATALRQVKFSKKFSFAKSWTNGGSDTFGTAPNVDLFLNPDQASIMSGTTMTLPGTANTITFKTVQYE